MNNWQVIPYLELLGNYSQRVNLQNSHHVISYQELSGDYSSLIVQILLLQIIPYQELSGDYSPIADDVSKLSGYTIPRIVREL